MDLRKRFIAPYKTIIEGLRLMDTLDKKLLLVIESDKFIGLVSAGDIQRAIIQNKPLNSKIGDILRKTIRVAKPGESFDDIKRTMISYRMELYPVIDANNEIEKIYFWEDIFQGKTVEPLEKFNLDVVIMAGGFGSRLSPLTNVLPKPLIPIGNKTMVEEIFERFNHHGNQHYHISINYKADLIEYYLKSQDLPYDIDFFREDQPLGTGGSLSLLKNKIHNTFFVTNCDILVEQDYSEILNFHRESSNEITIVAALKHYDIPYGTIETGENGQLLSLTEKPALTFKINSGMYVLEPHLISDIPEHEFFHITELIDKINKKGGKVGVFPISEGAWKDIGEWDEYLRHSKKKKTDE